MAACGFLCQASPSWSTPCWPPASPRPLPRPPRPHSPGLRQLQARRRGRSTAATRCPRPRTETAGKVRSGARFRLLPHVGISKIFSVSLKYNLYPPQTIRRSRRRSARAAWKVRSGSAGRRLQVGTSPSTRCLMITAAEKLTGTQF